MTYIFYDEVTGRIKEAVGDYDPYPTAVRIIVEDSVWSEAYNKGYNTVDLVTKELKYIDYRTDEEKEADRIKALIPKDEVWERAKRELETMYLLVELGKLQITYSEEWIKRFTILLVVSLVKITDVPELLRTEVQRRFDHWFD